MFFKGIYAKQLTVIAVLLMFLVIGQVAKSLDSFFEWAYGTPKTEQTIVKQTVEDNGVTFTSNKETSNPELDYGVDPETKEWMEDYQIRVIENGNKLVLYDGSRIIHVFDRAYNGNRNLFNVLDRDNL